MAPQLFHRGERSLDGSLVVHQVKVEPVPTQVDGKEPTSFFFSVMKDDNRRFAKASRRSSDSSQPQSTKMNVTAANFMPPGKSKFPSSSNNPTPSGPPNDPPFAIIRNNDPRVVYLGPWSLSGNMFVTTHSTTNVGSSVSLKFNGTGIVVFGTVPASNETVTPPTAVFSIDSNRPVQTSSPTAEKPISNQPLFAVNQLSLGQQHEINITVLKAEAPFTLESFFITTGSSVGWNNAVTNVTATGTEPTRTPSGTSSPKTSSSSQESPRPTPSPDPHVGLRVLAAVLGTILALVIIAAVIFLLRRRRSSRNHYGGLWPSKRDTRLTALTSPSSIIRATPSLFYTSNYSRSDGRSEYRSDGRLSYMTQTVSSPPPLPPKALIP